MSRVKRVCSRVTIQPADMSRSLTTPGLVIAAPSGLAQFCKQMDRLKTQLDNATQPMLRALQYISDQYQNSALCKQRTAKRNLTAACMRALANVRRTLRELVATFIGYTSDTRKQVQVMLSEQNRANAPNALTVQRIMRQQLQVVTLRT
jgi:hypothetical protein